MCTFLAYFHRSKIQLVVNVYFVNYLFFVSCLNTSNIPSGFFSLVSCMNGLILVFWTPKFKLHVYNFWIMWFSTKRCDKMQNTNTLLLFVHVYSVSINLVLNFHVCVNVYWRLGFVVWSASLLIYRSIKIWEMH